MADQKRIGVVLCGSGHRDGSEIHEATLTLLAIARAGAKALCFSPSGPQRFVRDHLTGRETAERREMMAESARIARGEVQDLARAKAAELDGMIIPGGQGAALNLSTFLTDGPSCTVHPELARLVREMHEACKPIGAICIAPATLGRALQMAGLSATMTIGSDAAVARQIEEMGHRHEPCQPTSCVVDREQRIVTTPAYMTAASIGEAWEGIEKLVGALLDLAW